MGQIANTSTYYGADGVQLLVPGGAPAALSGPIHLCTRADNNNTRYFDGKVAYLGGALPFLRGKLSHLRHERCVGLARSCPFASVLIALHPKGQFDMQRGVS